MLTLIVENFDNNKDDIKIYISDKTTVQSSLSLKKNDTLIQATLHARKLSIVYSYFAIKRNFIMR